MGQHQVYPHTHNRSSQRLRGERGKTLEEIIAKNFPNLMTNINLQIQEIQQTPRVINLRKSIPGHIIVKSQREKEILKIGKRKMIHTKEQKM